MTWWVWIHLELKVTWLRFLRFWIEVIRLTDWFLPRRECTRDENSVYPSVCPSIRLSIRLSIAWFVTKRKIFIPYEISFSLVFWEKEWFVKDDPFYLKFWVIGSWWSEIADFEPIFARSASAVKPSETSSINWLIRSSLRAFQWAIRRSSSVKWGSGVSRIS